jgi:hypothetical protein
MPSRREWTRTLVIGIALAGAFSLPSGMAKDKAPAAAFPSFSPDLGPPADWKGPVFQLSQDYPKAVTKEALPWMKIDFRTQPREYLMAVRAYAFEGNINRGNDANGNTLDWAVLTNPVRRWYHMPWRHPGNNGREFVHGLTMEFPSKPGTLDPNQKKVQNTYAVAMYGPVAAYTVGQVWSNPAGPPVMKAADFAEGALIAKLLFTTADVDDVPGVEGAYTWSANIYNDPTCTKLGCARSVRPVRLFQIDVALKDARAPKTAWVFGTFVYDKTVNGASVWDKMVPLGLMWGNDPALTAASPAGAAPQESIILKVGAYEHLGCHGRLSGPLDNAASACMSCHMAAQYPGTSPVPNTKTVKCDDPANAAFWRNLSGSEVFAPPTTGVKASPFDYSMEMASSVQNYMLAQKPAQFAPDGKTFTFKGERTVHHVVVRDQ